METIIEFFSHQKKLVAVIFASIMVFEVFRGYLKLFIPYAKTLKVKSFLIFFSAAVLGALLFLTVDEPVIRAVQTIQHPAALFLISVGTFFGKNPTPWFFYSALYFCFIVFRQPKFKELIFSAMVSSGLTSLSIHLIKYTFMRARPNKGLGPYHFFDRVGWQEHGNDFLSFASGDVAISAGAMSCFFLTIKHPIRWIFPCIAILTCFSRMHLDKHWPSDTAFSFLLSFVFASLVAGYLEFRKSRQNQI